MPKNPNRQFDPYPTNNQQYSVETVADIQAGHYDAIANGDALQHYLNEIATRPLLKPEEELELGKRIRRGLFAQDMLNDSELNLSEQDMNSLMATVHDGKLSQTKLFESNLRLVVSRSKSGKLQHMELLDVIQHGNIGLMSAVKKFDPDQGNKFSTYATHWIDKEIKLGKADHNFSVRIPEKAARYLHAIHFAHKDLEAALNRAPTDQELEEYVVLKDKKVDKAALIAAYRMHYTPHFSIDEVDESLGEEEEGGGVLDSFKNSVDETQNIEEEVYRSELSRGVRRLVAEAIKDYSERDKTILYMKLGFVTGYPLSSQEIGKAMQCDYKRPGQLERGLIQGLKEDPNLLGRLITLMAD